MLPLLTFKSGSHLPSFNSGDFSRSARSVWSPTHRPTRCCGWARVFETFAIVSIVFLSAFLLFCTVGTWRDEFSSIETHLRTSVIKHSENDVLVMYIFSNTDPEYLENLKYFLREGVRENDGCEYIFVVNRSPEEEMVRLPPLPTNARYLQHPNECYDWGTFGWILSTQNINVSKYKHFIFMNSSVRGPFIPAYMKGHVHWADVLLSKLSDEVKLVGPTINCEGSPLAGNPASTWRRNPHVQSYVVATDQIGMNIMLENSGIFKCYESMWDTIYHSELGSSAAILEAGYNIDSLMVRYQGIDWRDQANWGCNEGRNPYGNHYLDGANLEAMEVMFVKVKRRLLDLKWGYPWAAAMFDHWKLSQDEGKPDIHSNRYVKNEAEYKLSGVLDAAMRGFDCFDCPFYQHANPDLPSTWSCLQQFDHYINSGQFEGRPSSMAALPHVPQERIDQLKAEASPLPGASTPRGAAMGLTSSTVAMKSDPNSQHGNSEVSRRSRDVKSTPKKEYWAGNTGLPTQLLLSQELEEGYSYVSGSKEH